MLSHAEVLLTKQAPTEELFEAATLPTEFPRSTDELVNNLRFELGRKEVQVANYDRGLLSSSSCFAVFWILLALHQRRRSGAAAAAAGPALAPAAEPGAPDGRGRRRAAVRSRAAGPIAPCRASGRARGPRCGGGPGAANGQRLRRQLCGRDPRSRRPIRSTLAWIICARPSSICRDRARQHRQRRRIARRDGPRRGDGGAGGDLGQAFARRQVASPTSRSGSSPSRTCRTAMSAAA